MSPPAQHPTTATQMAIEQHARMAYEALDLLCKALAAEAEITRDFNDASEARSRVYFILQDRGLLNPAPKPPSQRT